MVPACQAPLQPLQNHPSGHLGRWATMWSAEEMLDEQYERVGVPARTTNADKDRLQERLEDDLC